jgi:hypothetical protein
VSSTTTATNLNGEDVTEDNILKNPAQVEDACESGDSSVPAGVGALWSHLSTPLRMAQLQQH